ncbi:phage tail protein [Salmonella enterica]|nr:phage tail protein [Salmonella enterica]EHW4334183.1 phage tail protein [Salmonella enterica subsp. enterica serovar Enteritidis]EIR2469229.1 phage tail protein [Salmonella enterica subsp. enterica serovar Glostrup]EIR2618508.1 phage tail protein [Salmonella enterica subsp. enterica serovar Miami]EIR7579583.1 phage tail protein [Salmonella enterica subsp. enterica serovar Oranienburg]
MNAWALIPDDLVIVESASEKIDTISCKMTVPPSGHHNGFFFCTC